MHQITVLVVRNAIKQGFELIEVRPPERWWRYVVKSCFSRRLSSRAAEAGSRVSEDRVRFAMLRRGPLIG
jgi:hypothetical protein